MKTITVFISLALGVLWQQPPVMVQKIPHLEKRHGAIQLIVAGKPFTMVCGELHNSTASAPDYFDEALKNAQQMQVNSVIASVSWEQLEPEEHHYNFSLTDHIIKAAHAAHLKLVLIWFASWKNGESSYMPLWAKKDTKRFFRIRDRSGKEMSAVSPFCQAAMQADAKAFTALMQHIRLKNRFNDVVMMQVENESGAFSDIDHGMQAQELYRTAVPAKLTSYLQQHKATLDDYIKNAWERNGAKMNGRWADLFGEDSLVAQHLFMTWQYASYIGEVCQQGKKAYNIPMYVNAWQDHPGQLPGVYPNGGPVAKGMDVYRAAAPAIDFIAPDVYLPNYRQICDKYFKPEKQNPLFVPECERTNPGKAFYALAQDDAIGFGPFGIESMIANPAYAQSNAVLNELLPLITRYQGTGRMRAFLQEGNEDSTSADMGEYHIAVKFTSKSKRSFGLIIQTGDQDFLVAGMDCRLTFSARRQDVVAQIGEVLEGGFWNQQWRTTRRLNGDETWHDRVLVIGSRSYKVTYQKGVRHSVQVLAPAPVLDEALEPGLQINQVAAPAIYKVKVFELFNE
jgi:hypothetical protein